MGRGIEAGGRRVGEMSGDKKKTMVRPMRARPGARYQCFGDGLCCTDIHAIGPLTDKEVREVRRIDPKGAGWDEDHEDNMLRTAADGGCRFLMPDMRCSIHAELGPAAKPDGCRRFPLGLVATPHGGRITTEHRCPCRTLGDRPQIAPEAVVSSICDAAGRPTADRRIKRVPVTKKKKIAFSEWESIEQAYLDKLRDCESLHEALDAKAFPKLGKTSWESQAEEFIDARDGSQFGVAMAWMGDTILSLRNGHQPRPPGRPWAAAFDRAEARSGEPRTQREVFADWLADEIWGLKWAEDYNFELARAELATRLTIAQDICRRLVESGLRPDRAAAEAVMVVELVGESDYWTEVKDFIRV